MQFKSATALIGLAVCASIARADSGWSLDTGLVHTDNATLANAGGPSDTVESAGGAVAWEEKTRLLDATLNGAGSMLHYQHHTYDDDFLGQAAGNAVIQLLPERIAWTFTDNYGQIAHDPFAPVTPDNRQNVNVFNAGPDFNLRLGGQTRLQLAGRYGDMHYEDSDQIDTRNWGGSIGVQHQLSKAASLGIFASQNRYVYEARGLPLYDQQAGWVSWQSTGARQTLSVDVGANRIDSALESQTRPLARVTWQRRVRPSWTMNLQLDSEYQNTGQQFAGGGGANVGISTLPAANRRADLSFTFERSRTSVDFGGGVGKVNYVGTAQLDEDTWRLHADMSHRFTPRVQGLLSYRIDRRNYQTGPDLGIRVWTGAAGLDWRLGRAVFLTAGYTRTDSHGDATLNRYSSNVWSLRLSWRGGKAAAPRTLGF